MRKLAQLSEHWGVSIQALVYRSKELGLISDSAARRAYIKLHELAETPAVALRPVRQYPGEVPAMLAQALELAGKSSVTLASVAAELAWKPSRVRRLLGETDSRPALTLV